MLNKIIYYSLHNRLVVLICSLLLMIAGTYTAFHTDVDVFPDLNAPTVVIMTEANGMAPEEVERLVTFPVETAVMVRWMCAVSVRLLRQVFLSCGLNSIGERIFTGPVRSFPKSWLSSVRACRRMSGNRRWARSLPF